MDMAKVKGRESVKRALEIAAAGGHNVLMLYPITLQIKSQPASLALPPWDRKPAGKPQLAEIKTSLEELA